MKKLIHRLLVYLGIRPCCDKPNIIAHTDNEYYYEYQCLHCGNTKSGGRDFPR